MTAEIAILNKSAVALAADSVLTVGYGNEQKTYHTNKLFMLSEVNPVGIMIFNNANLLGVPWETIIKHYRKSEGTRTFDNLHQYADAFLSYLENNTFLFPEHEQDKQAIHDILSGFIFLRHNIDASIEELAHSSRKFTLADIEHIVQVWIETSHDVLWKIPLPVTYPVGHKRMVFARYVTAIEVLIDEVFQTLPLKRELKKKLRRIGLSLLLASNAMNGENYTGIVIAGFGDKD